MNFRRLLLRLAPAALVMGLCTTASAIPITGSIAFTHFVSSYTGANLAAATQITLNPLPNGLVTSSTGGFVGLTPITSAVVMTVSPFSAPLGVYSSFITWGDINLQNRFTFSSLISTTASTSPDDLTIKATGIFHDTLGTYDNQTASLLISLTQVGGPGNAVSISGTIATPGAFTLTPEPASMALMGSALIAVGLIGRRKLLRR